MTKKIHTWIVVQKRRNLLMYLNGHPMIYLSKDEAKTVLDGFASITKGMKIIPSILTYHLPPKKK